MLGNALTAAVSLSTTAGDISEDVTLSSDTEPVINVKKEKKHMRTSYAIIALSGCLSSCYSCG